MGFQGSVESFSLADVFQNLAMNQQTGTLRIFVPDTPQERHVFFEAGQVQALSHGSRKPLLLGEIVLGRGLVTEVQLQTALARQKEANTPLGACLVELTFLTVAQVDELLSHQIEEEIYELFSWEKALFEFADGQPPEGLFLDRGSGKGPSLPISHLIMEAARRVDEWERLRRQVPSFREVYAVEESARKAISSGQLETDAVERRVLQLVDSRRDVDDLIQDSYLFRFEVMQALSGFLQSSLIRPATAEELAQAAEALQQSGQTARRAKILERLLTLGGDRPDVRRALADALAETSQGERASIHFSVLAEGELQAGNEESAVSLFRRILQIVPHHLASRERLGAIYARRGQKREAYVQYQELMKLYQGKQQWSEARLACLRACECDPLQVELRRELITLYLAEGDKAAATRECEALGDLLARQGQSRSAADCYRRGMQLSPGLTHLKKKLADVMLTQEDRRARRRRNVTAAAVVVGLVSIVGIFVFREIGLSQDLRAALIMSRQASNQARELEDQQKYAEAASKCEEAISLLNCRAARSWSFGGYASSVNEEMAKLERLRETTSVRAAEQHQTGTQDGSAALDAALREQKLGNLYAAREGFQKVLDNRYSEPKDKAGAEENLAKVNERIKAFEEGLALLKKPPREAFPDVQQEYKFKEEFVQRFHLVPQLDRNTVLFPLQVALNVDNVRVLLDGQLLDVASRGRENVFRYSRVQPHKFEFLKDGYRSKALVTNNELGPTVSVTLEREPSKVVDLGVTLAGEPCFDGQSLFVGTAAGGLIQLDPQTLETKWKFEPALPAGENEVYGSIVPFTMPQGKKLLVYLTRAGNSLAAEPGRAEPALPVVSVTQGQPLRAVPGVGQVSLAGRRLFFLLPVGRRVRVVDVETRTPLWPGGASDELPQSVTTTPVLVEQGDAKLIVAGCEDGNLYGWDLSDGRRTRLWPGRGAGLRAAPLVAGNVIVVGSADGNLYFFDLKGGQRGGAIDLKGCVTSPPVLQRRTAYIGTSTGDGLYAIDLDRQSTLFAFRGDQIRGGVTCAPAVAGNRVYFGTEEGLFYAFDREDRQAERLWSYSTLPIPSRLVGTPVVVGRRAIFLCANGKVFAFDD